MSEVSIQPPNSLILIGDPKGEVPELSSELVSATSTCIAVGTLAQDDGPMHVRLLDGSGEHQSLPSLLAWEGFLDLPSGIMSVENVIGETYFERKVEVATIHIRVYVNHGSEPDQIAILVR